MADKPNDNSPYIRFVCELFDNNLDDVVRTETITAPIDCSDLSLVRKVKKQFGITNKKTERCKTDGVVEIVLSQQFSIFIFPIITSFSDCLMIHPRPF